MFMLNVADTQMGQVHGFQCGWRNSFACWIGHVGNKFRTDKAKDFRALLL
jgi:hypothetical protein